MTLRVSVDVVVLTLAEPGTILRMVTSAEAGLPGSELGEEEDLETAATRVMTGIGLRQPRHVEQLASFGDPGRVPGTRTVSVAYLALVPEPFELRSPHQWVDAVNRTGALRWDHDRIADAAVRRVRSKLSYSNIAYGLLPDEFTMTELQEVYEAVLGTTLDKRNFRKKVRLLGLLADTGRQRRGPHRPAALYRFASPDLVLLDDTIT